METKQEELTEQNNTEKKKSKKKKWILGIILGVTVFLVILIYILIALYFSDRFFPGTIINGINYGSEDTVAVMAVLSAGMQDYQLELNGRDPATGEKGKLSTILAQDIDLRTSTGEEDIKGLLSRQNKWLWPACLWTEKNEYTLAGSILIDEDKLEAFLDNIPAFQTSNMTAPRDAYIRGYSDADKCFVIEPELKGTQLDVGQAKDAIRNAIDNGVKYLDLDEEGFYAEPAITEDNADLQKIIQEANKCLQTKITYDWGGNEVVLDVEQIKDWVSIENGKTVLNEDAVGEFVAGNAKKYDTFGRNRDFVTTLGIELNLPSAYGWRTDRAAEKEALVEQIKEGVVESREPAYTYRGASKGEDDIGNSYVEIDLTNQHLYLYQNGEIVLESDFVSGNMSNGNATPPGIFGLTYKTKNAVLRGADYTTPVNYWMPFNGNVGMHDATWRGAFGGQIYLTGGSHGCVNLPLSKAAEIYEYVSKDFPVICYYYPSQTVLPQDPENPDGQESENGENPEQEYQEVQEPVYQEEPGQEYQETSE